MTHLEMSFVSIMPAKIALILLGGLEPNRSLNADVPHAGLRPGMRPPVSLFR
jgi:hypothetical protein